jgi:hypothetical protein
MTTPILRAAYPIGPALNGSREQYAVAMTIGTIDETDTSVDPTGSWHPNSQSKPAFVQMVGPGSAAPAATSTTAAIDTIGLVTASTAQQLPSVPTTFGATIQNQSASDTIYVGTSNAVTAAGAHGFRLTPGQVLGVSGANLSLYWFNGPSTGSTLGYSL